MGPSPPVRDMVRPGHSNAVPIRTSRVCHLVGPAPPLRKRIIWQEEYLKNIFSALCSTREESQKETWGCLSTPLNRKSYFSIRTAWLPAGKSKNKNKIFKRSKCRGDSSDFGDAGSKSITLKRTIFWKMLERTNKGSNQLKLRNIFEKRSKKFWPGILIN